MKRSSLYLLLCAFGVVVPWIFLALFLGEEPISVSLFFAYIFHNHVSTSVAADLLISAFIFFVFALIEGRRIGMSGVWVYIPATLMVGLSFGLPLFLYFRERQLGSATQAQA